MPQLVDGEGRLVESMRREPTVLRAFADAILGARAAGSLVRLGETVSDPRAYQRLQPTDWAEGSTSCCTCIEVTTTYCLGLRLLRRADDVGQHGDAEIETRLARLQVTAVARLVVDAERN